MGQTDMLYDREAFLSPTLTASDSETVRTGVKNMRNAANSSTLGSSRCRSGFWRTESQAQTCDSDLRSLMSVEDMNDFARTLPIEA